MTKSIIFIIVIGFILNSCSNKPTSRVEKSNKSNDCLSDSVSALNKGKKLLTEMYGGDSTSRSFKVILTNDSTWTIISQATVHQEVNMDDSVYLNLGAETVQINKHSCEVIGFFIAR